MQSFYGNTTATSASRSSLRAGDAQNSRRHTPIGPSRTRLVNRHNPYATTPSQQDLEGLAPKGHRRNRREGRSRPSTKRSSATTADTAVVTPTGTWEGAPQDATVLLLPKSTPAEPEPAPVCASTPAFASNPTTPRLLAQEAPLDEFGLYSFIECGDNSGPDFFGSFDLGCSASYPEQTAATHEEEEISQITSRAATPHPEPARSSAGKINLSSLHHRLMRSKGCVPDISLDQVDGVVRQHILRYADQLMFKHQAQSREQRKWHGYREPEDNGLLKRPRKKVRFSPFSTEGRNRKKRPVISGMDELVRRVNRVQLSA